MTMLSDGMLLGAGGAITGFISSATAIQASGTATITINKPADVQTGDLLIAIIWGNSSLTAVSLAGWTVADSGFTGNARHSILTRVADGSEGSTFAFTSTSAANRNGAILCYRGYSSIQVGTKTQASSATATAASFSASNAGILIAAFVIISTGRAVSTPPTSMTQRSFNNATLSAATYGLSPSPSGSTPAKTLVWDLSTDVAGIAMQIS